MAGEISHICLVCKKQFKSKQNLTRHMLIHSGEKPYPCANCGRAFRQAGDRRNHMRVHENDRPHQCQVCGKRFIQSTHLKVHLRQHSGERPFKCSECTKCFTKADHLRVHLRIHTGERPYQCSECGKTFRDKNTHTKHMKIHFGMKNYGCEICDLAFADKAHLVRHMKVHGSKNPYRCGYCTADFMDSSDLVNHVQEHYDKEPFQCGVCGEIFKECDTLDNHVKELHIEIPRPPLDGDMSDTARFAVAAKEVNTHQDNITMVSQQPMEAANEMVEVPTALVDNVIGVADVTSEHIMNKTTNHTEHVTHFDIPGVPVDQIPPFSEGVTYYTVSNSDVIIKDAQAGAGTTFESTNMMGYVNEVPVQTMDMLADGPVIEIADEITVQTDEITHVIEDSEDQIQVVLSDPTTGVYL